MRRERQTRLSVDDLVGAAEACAARRARIGQSTHRLGRELDLGAGPLECGDRLGQALPCRVQQRVGGRAFNEERERMVCCHGVMVRWFTIFEIRHQSWTYIVAPVRALRNKKIEFCRSAA